MVPVKRFFICKKTESDFAGLHEAGEILSVNLFTQIEWKIAVTWQWPNGRNLKRQKNNGTSDGLDMDQARVNLRIRGPSHVFSSPIDAEDSCSIPERAAKTIKVLLFGLDGRTVLLGAHIRFRPRSILPEFVSRNFDGTISAHDSQMI
jgi:hypothetical protein